jgi:hypothetical protein
MNKIIAISLITVLSVTLTGCTLLNSSKDKNTEQNTQQEQQKETGNQENPEDNKSVFSSIKDAVSQQIGLKCEYQDEEGVKATTYIKGNNMYMESEVENDDVTVKVKGVMKDQKYYLWSDDNKQGMVFDLSKVETEGKDTPLANVQSQDEIIAKLEENKNNCKPENIAPSMFETPSDVQFVELNF